MYAQAPVDSRLPMLVEQYQNEPYFLDEYDQHGRLDRMEQALRICPVWLDRRFPGVYGYVETVIDLRGRLNDGIERQLKGKRPLWQRRRR